MGNSEATGVADAGPGGVVGIWSSGALRSYEVQNLEGWTQVLRGEISDRSQNIGVLCSWHSTKQRTAFKRHLLICSGCYECLQKGKVFDMLPINFRSPLDF